MTIEQTVEILVNHRLVLEVPPEIPAGRTILTFTPVPAVKNGSRTALEAAPVSPAIEILKQEAAQKAAMRRTSGRDPFEELRKSMKGRPFLNGIDGVEYQRSIRNEWPD